MNRPAPVPATVDYPCSDGKPMAESDFQLEPLVYAITALRTHFADREHVYVAGDMFLYFKEGDPRAVVAPDVFVVVGAPRHKRHSYKLWEEPKPPDFALEVASPSSWKRDLKEKKAIYESMGVKEYFACDPRADFYEPPLQGFRLEGGVYVPLVTKRRGSVWTLHSEVLGLTFRQFGKEVRLMDPATGKDLPTHDELLYAQEDLLRTQRNSIARAEAEATRRRAAEERQRAAEARIAELEALLAQRRPNAEDPSPS